MRVALLLPLCACLSLFDLSAATIGYAVTAVGPHTFHYDYFLSGTPFLINQELDIRFDASVFGTISNETAGSGFFVVPCCQPNNPPGVFGDYEILALTNVSNPTGQFGVDVTVPGSSVPGSQPFFVNQLDASGVILFNVTAGFTGSATQIPGVAPEPSSASLLVIAALGGLGWAARRRLRSPIRAS